MAGNKKIANATSVSLSGIKFKSKLERTVYTTLKENGFNPEYEIKTFVLIDSFIPKTPFYDKETDKQFAKRKEKEKSFTPRKLVLKSGVVQSIKYTPDFYFNYKGINVYIEAKGFENNVFYIKKKLFIRLLDSMNVSSLYFEIYTKNQLLQAIDIIKNSTVNEIKGHNMEC